MSAVNITFIGGPDAGNVGSTTWGLPSFGEIEFPLNKPVTIDIDALDPKDAKRSFYEHVIAKARRNRFFTVEDAKPAKAEAKKEVPKVEEAEEVTIPDDWRDMHHASQIKLAHDLGGADVTTKAEAIAYIEKCLDA